VIVVHTTARTPALQNKVLSILCGLSLCADLIVFIHGVFVCNLFLSYIQALSLDIQIFLCLENFTDRPVCFVGIKRETFLLCTRIRVL
jgi:hypothetical protein